MAKQPDPAPKLPVFLPESWHKVHGGLHLTFLSLVCSFLALLPIVAVSMAIGLGMDMARPYRDDFAAAAITHSR